MYWNSQYFSNGSGLSCNVCPAHLQFAEGDDGSQIRVSILSPRADISLETGAGNTLVKRKKGGFQDLSGQKSDRQSYYYNATWILPASIISCCISSYDSTVEYKRSNRL